MFLVWIVRQALPELLLNKTPSHTLLSNLLLTFSSSLQGGEGSQRRQLFLRLLVGIAVTSGCTLALLYKHVGWTGVTMSPGQTSRPLQPTGRSGDGCGHARMILRHESRPQKDATSGYVTDAMQ